MTTRDELAPGMIVRFNKTVPNDRYEGMEVVLREFFGDDPGHSDDEWTFEIVKAAPEMQGIDFQPGRRRTDTIGDSNGLWVDIIGDVRPPEFFSTEDAQRWLDEQPVHAHVDLDNDSAKAK